MRPFVADEVTRVAGVPGARVFVVPVGVGDGPALGALVGLAATKVGCVRGVRHGEGALGGAEGHAHLRESSVADKRAGFARHADARVPGPIRVGDGRSLARLGLASARAHGESRLAVVTGERAGGIDAGRGAAAAVVGRALVDVFARKPFASPLALGAAGVGARAGSLRVSGGAGRHARGSHVLLARALGDERSQRLEDTAAHERAATAACKHIAKVLENAVPKKDRKRSCLPKTSAAGCSPLASWTAQTCSPARAKPSLQW